MVTGLDVQERVVVLGEKSFGDAGAYEKIVERAGQRWDWIHASPGSVSAAAPGARGQDPTP